MSNSSTNLTTKCLSKLLSGRIICKFSRGIHRELSNSRIEGQSRHPWCRSAWFVWDLASVETLLFGGLFIIYVSMEGWNTFWFVKLLLIQKLPTCLLDCPLGATSTLWSWRDRVMSPLKLPHMLCGNSSQLVEDQKIFVSTVLKAAE